MYVCTDVRMYLCNPMYVCTYVRMYVCTYVPMYLCNRMYVCTYVRMYGCTHVRMNACTDVRMSDVRMYVCTYVRNCTYVCMYVCRISAEMCWFVLIMRAFLRIITDLPWIDSVFSDFWHETWAVDIYNRKLGRLGRILALSLRSSSCSYLQETETEN